MWFPGSLPNAFFKKLHYHQCSLIFLCSTITKIIHQFLPTDVLFLLYPSLVPFQKMPHFDGNLEQNRPCLTSVLLEASQISKSVSLFLYGLKGVFELSDRARWRGRRVFCFSFYSDFQYMLKMWHSRLVFSVETESGCFLGWETKFQKEIMLLAEQPAFQGMISSGN